MLTIKALHIIALVAWFSALFYLPRLFVYHADAEDRISQERFVVMERRLYFSIAWPAAIFTIVFGGALLWMLPGYMQALWFHWKLSLVLLVLVYHGLCGYYVRQFRLENNLRSSFFFRIFNEIPTVLLVGIVFLTVLKPAI